MKNKSLIILVGIVTIFLAVLLGLRHNFSDNVKKLKSDISYPESNGLAFSCEKTTIDVDEEVTCTLVGKYEGGIYALNGQIEVSSNLEIVKVSYDSEVWTKLGSFPEVSFMKSDAILTGEQFIVLEVKFKGVTSGNGELKFTKMNGQQHVSIVNVVNGGHIDIDDAVQAISVTDSSSSGGGESGGGGEEEPTLSSIKTLETLTVSAGTLSPQFGRTTYNYIVVVPNNVTQISVGGSATDSANATISGLNTYNIAVGANDPIRITVTAQDGTTQDYFITVTREAPIDVTKSSDNKLKNLSVTGLTLTPAFSASVTSYNATVENSVTSVEVNAEVNDITARISVNNPETLEVGNNTITIKVTAENNDVKIYTIVVNRKAKNSETQTCVLELTSAAYKIDNTKQIIDLVNQDDTNETITKNLSASCGSFSVSNDKVVLAIGDQVKTYTINRVFVPKTGQNPIKYIAIVLGIVLIIGILIFVKKKMDK